MQIIQKSQKLNTRNIKKYRQYHNDVFNEMYRNLWKFFNNDFCAKIIIFFVNKPRFRCVTSLCRETL